MNPKRKKQRTDVLRKDDILLGFLFAWIADRDSAAYDALRRYCEYICFHGCPSFPSDVIDALADMDKWSAVTWIQQTHAQYVQDERAMIRYILGV